MACPDPSFHTDLLHTDRRLCSSLPETTFGQAATLI